MSNTIKNSLFGDITEQFTFILCVFLRSFNLVLESGVYLFKIVNKYTVLFSENTPQN